MNCFTKDGSVYKWGLARRHVSGELDAVEPWAEMERHPVDAFRKLWDSIYAARGHGWSTNPWIWSVTFRLAGN